MNSLSRRPQPKERWLSGTRQRRRRSTVKRRAIRRATSQRRATKRATRVRRAATQQGALEINAHIEIVSTERVVVAAVTAGIDEIH